MPRLAHPVLPQVLPRDALALDIRASALALLAQGVPAAGPAEKPSWPGSGRQL
jgi:hypothetical protein